MKCEYCKTEQQYLNSLILPYVSNDNNHEVKSKVVKLCKNCFIQIRNRYEAYLTPYSYEKLLTLTMIYENLFAEGGNNEH